MPGVMVRMVLSVSNVLLGEGSCYDNLSNSVLSFIMVPE